MFSLLLGILLIGLVSVMAQGDGQGNAQNQQQKIKAGNYTGEGGQQIQIQEKTNNRIQLRVRNVSADTDLEITQEQIQNRSILRAKLSNGINAEIKVMPNTASERALERLRLKVCSAENNCTIVLKEVGKGEQIKLAYELNTQRQARFLGLFRTKMQVQAQVDAENGEIIRVKKPWWAFLATEPEEQEEEPEEPEEE